MDNSKDTCDCLEGLYRELAEKVRLEVKENGSTLLKFNPLKLDFTDDVEAGDLLRSEYLKNVNQNYSFALGLMNLNKVTTPRKGFLGKIILKIKRRIQKFLAGMLSNYINDQINFNADTVRFLNEIARYVDKRDNYIFLELIRKIDIDLESLNRKLDELSDAQNVIEASAKKELEEYHNNNMLKFIKESKLRDSNIQVRISVLSSIVEGLEKVLASLNGTKNVNDDVSKNNQNPSSKTSLENIDYKYLFLENRYRGESADIKQRLLRYVDIIKNSSYTLDNVIEIGSGRGELLEVLKEHNINALGVELDSAMCDVLKEKNLSFVQSDALSYFKTLGDSSVSLVIGIQIIEHLSLEYIDKLFFEAYRVLKKGGALIFETVNPLSIYALTNNFFKDYTHRMPLHPETLSYLAKLKGFKAKEPLFLSKVSSDIMLSKLDTDSFMMPSEIKLIEKVNQNISKLNSFLYGAQDYAMILKK